MNTDTLYQQTILEYSRQQNHHRDMLDATDIERGHNPNCGDDLTLIIKIQDNLVKDLSFLGSGCAISTASTNMLIELIRGQSLEQAKRIITVFFKMMNNETLNDSEKDLLGDALLLEITARMPARKKCATLSWHSAKILIEKVEKNKP